MGLASALLVVVALAGCVPGDLMRQWLVSQPGVRSAEIQRDDYSSDTRVLRAELDPAATDHTIVALIRDAVDFAESRPRDALPLVLGIGQVDFEVTTVTESAKSLEWWRSLLEIDNLIDGMVTPDGVTVSAPRPAMLDTLGALPSGTRREVRSSGESDWDFVVAADPGCVPAAEPLAFAGHLLSMEKVEAADLDLCAGFQLTYSADSLATRAIELRDELESRGLGDFPVQMRAWRSIEDTGLYSIWVTPGERSWVELAGEIERSRPDFRFALGKDGLLEVSSNKSTALEVLNDLLAARGAESFDRFSVRGTDTGVTGTLEYIQALLG